MTGGTTGEPAAGAELFEVRVVTSFEAAHRRGRTGAQAPLHHHLWNVAVRARARELDGIGVVLDFRRLRAATDEVVAELDQRVLEDLPPFHEAPATADRVARWIFDRLRERLPGGRAWLHAVEIDAGDGEEGAHRERE